MSLKEKTEAPVSCIVLNKSFIGSYLDGEGHNAHEVINFLKADDGNNYIYCNPYGQNVKDSENYNIQYFVVTTEEHKGIFYIEYVFEVKDVLHVQTMPKTLNRDELEKNAAAAEKQICEKLKIKSLDEITYNGVPVRKIAEDNGDVVTIPVTFIAGKILKAKKPVKIIQKNKDYKFQRNFGYVSEEKGIKTYTQILNQIKTEENWETVDFSDSEISKDTEIKHTFMDLIDMHREEECYTRILGNLFGCNHVLNVPAVKEFIRELYDRNKIQGFEKIDFSDLKMYTEYSIPNDKNVKNKKNSGRVDLLFTCENLNLIIENKVDSGINYVKDGNNKSSQMERYYRYFHDIGKKDLYFILAPVNKVLSLKEELDNLDDVNKNNYRIIDYSFIYDFACKHKDLILNENFEFKKYYDDILSLFKYLTFDNKKICEMKLLENQANTHR